VVAQEGIFKDERGKFTKRSLEKIVELGNAESKGVRVRFGHPTLSDDGLGKFMGRATNFRIESDSGMLSVRADMSMNDTAMSPPPNGGRPLGEYVMELADTDPDAFSSSLALYVEELDPEDEGEPNVWIPRRLVASDVVDTGDAVDAFLSPEQIDDLPTGIVHNATKLIDRQFEGQPRDVTEARLTAFVERYLSYRYGKAEESDMGTDDKAAASDSKRLNEVDAKIEKLSGSIEKLATLFADDLKNRQDTKAKSDRSDKIVGLCAMVGLDSAKANEFIADETLSVEDVKDQLLQLKIENLKPAGDSGEADTGDAKVLREYREHANIHSQMGITAEDYLAFTKGSDEPEMMSPAWADKYRKENLLTN